MTQRTNAQWLHDLQTDGPASEQAITQLHQILTSGLRRGLLAQVNTSAPEFETLADDFAQDAILKILSNLKSFSGQSKFTTWAHKIAVNVTLTELRRKRWQDQSLDGMTDAAEGDYTPKLAADTSPTPENAAERAEAVAHVKRLLAEALTEKQRTALVASVFQGHSTNEIAQNMSMKPNAVYKLLHDARLRLKRSLAQEGLAPSDIITVFQ